jgi:predicted Zn-ribbon and HTH transcriptional regulator
MSPQREVTTELEVRSMGIFGKRNKSETIDLRAHGGHIDLVAMSTMGQEWGQPGHCPECGHQGFLDRIDLVGRELYQHCPSCEHRWITSEAELKTNA